jgi:hypothetical protein
MYESGTMVMITAVSVCDKPRKQSHSSLELCTWPNFAPYCLKVGFVTIGNAHKKVEIIHNFQNAKIIYNYFHLLHLWNKFCLHHMMHELRSNDWRHKSRDYNIKNLSNVKVKFKMDVYNKIGCIFLHKFAQIVKFVTCVWEVFVSNSGQITDCSDWGSSSCYSVPPDDFKSESDNFLQKLDFRSLSYFQNTWRPHTGTSEHYFCCLSVQKR